MGAHSNANMYLNSNWTPKTTTLILSNALHASANNFSFWRIIKWTSFIVRGEVLLSGNWLLFCTIESLSIYLNVDVLRTILNLLSLILSCDIDQLGIALKVVFIVESWLSWMTISTKRHIHICATNQGLHTLISSSKSERRVLFAKFTDSW
jgi:hypothetical protein